MPDLFYLLSRWWRKMMLIILITLISVTVLLLLMPRKYLSEATALRASSYTNDKASIFNRNIEALYSTLGSADDLDMIIGTAQLDTVYLAQVDSFDLVSHYKVKGEPATARRKGAIRLRKESKVMKSGYGELKVKVWDKQKDMAANLANGIMDKLQSIHQRLLNESNVSTLAGLRERLRKIQERPGIDSAAPSKDQDVIRSQMVQYENLIGEYELMVDTRQPALLIVEQARPAIKHDKPKYVPILVATLVLSALFAFFVALILERRKSPLI